MPWQPGSTGERYVTQVATGYQVSVPIGGGKRVVRLFKHDTYYNALEAACEWRDQVLAGQVDPYERPEERHDERDYAMGDLWTAAEGQLPRALRVLLKLVPLRYIKQAIEELRKEDE